MNKFLNSLLTVALLLTTLTMVGCSEESSSTGDNTEVETPSDESQLLIEVDTQSISIDNSEVATFTVLLDGKDVTSDSEIINITDGGYDTLHSNTFTTFRPGTHTFFAIYEDMNSDKVSILATSESNISSTYYRRHIIMKFTATSCTYCPAMSSTIEGAAKTYPDRIIEVAAHSGDELSTNTSNAYNTLFGVQYLPWIIVDMNANYSFGDRVISKFNDCMTQSTTDNPTVCGIKLDTNYEDGKLSVDVESTFVADDNYKILVWILQSGYTYSQTGGTDGYTQDHVIFTPLTDTYGDTLGDLVVGEKIQRSYSFDYIAEIGAEIDTTQTEVVVCILNETATATYAVNNALSCGVNDSIDYQFEPIVEE
ncbi:MAG: Omp28-related outer membrane protein [Rikenellaceae bacterium]